MHVVSGPTERLEPVWTAAWSIAAGVLVTDDHGRTLVDTARLEHARPGETSPVCGQRRRSTSAAHSQRPHRRPTPDDGEALAVVEPPPELWSTTETTGDQPAEPDAQALPQLEPTSTLAAPIAARVALEAARQPVTRDQLVAR